MNASRAHTCPRCGADMIADTPGTPCPACLLSGAIPPIEDETPTVSMSSTSRPEPMSAGRLPRELGGYRLLGLLGSGGMGRVYEAEQLADGRRVALKMLDQQLDSPEMRNRFLREGRLAASVHHPNSLFVFGAEEVDSVPVITMEIAGGGTLKDRLEKRGPFPVTEAVDAILDVIAGLEAAFAAGVLHRDVKPSNCFVGADGSVKVGDFGLSVSTMSREDSHATADEVVMGTPAYAPPEQLRGDALDERADIYSVGATLFSLLTARAPFSGKNAVQVVVNAMSQRPPSVKAIRDDAPPGLESVVARCLAKEPRWRYENYRSLRDALLPFSSRVAEPASMLARTWAGWIDYLVALLPAYVVLMFWVGGEELLVRPLVERTLDSARYYLALLAVAVLYSTVTEGIWGAGLGKWLRGLRVVGPGARRPGPGRALVRALVPLLAVETIRVSISMTFISSATWTGLQTTLFVLTAAVSPCVVILLAWRARRENGYATLWDRISGTRVVHRVKTSHRPLVEPLRGGRPAAGDETRLGPFRVDEAIVAGVWVRGTDPTLRRAVWLIRRDGTSPDLARRRIARVGRPRWLQSLVLDQASWEVFEAIPGAPFLQLVDGERRVAWVRMRHWLHDLASELWHSSLDGTMPAAVELAQVWITAEGRAMLLDEPWPDLPTPSARFDVDDAAGQQRFLAAVAAHVEATSLPVHARGVLRNLASGTFEKLSFLTGTLRGLLDRPAEVTSGLRAGSLFVIPTYAWIAVVVGRYHDKPWSDPAGILLTTALAVLGGVALMRLLGIPFRVTPSHTTFRLAVLDDRGEPAARSRMVWRWAIVWLPLSVPALLMVWRGRGGADAALIAAIAGLALWLGAVVHTLSHPHRAWHDRLAGTWVVRR